MVNDLLFSTPDAICLKNALIDHLDLGCQIGFEAA